MSFIATQGGKKRYQAKFEIRSRSTTKAGRRQELSKFKAALRKLAKRHGGKVK